MSKNNIILNKYGALSPEQLKELLNKVELLENIVKDFTKAFACIWMELYGENEIFDKGNLWAFDREVSIGQAFYEERLTKKNSIIRKLIKLTNADDYEYIYTTETKIIDKVISKIKKGK